MIRMGTTIALIMALAACERQPTPAELAAQTAFAYPIAPAATGPAPPPDAVKPLHVEGSTVALTEAQTKDLFAPPDWTPASHPVMPPIVGAGRKPEVQACGFCHLPTGDGRPENASLAGLPRAYIVEQMAALADGSRHSSVANRRPPTMMSKLAKVVTPEEVAAAADYFSALRHHSFTNVVEADSVPRTVTTGWIYHKDPAGGTEPLGARIIELPVDFERFELRDPATPYIAYVPKGSLEKGAKLVASKDDAQRACAKCHGVDLRGTDKVPGLAGRSPTSLMRQLNDIRTGARNTAGVEPMKPIVGKMSANDMIAVAAYLGTLAP